MVKRTDFERMLAKLTELIKVAIQPGEAMHVLIDFSAGLLGSGFLSAIRNLPFGLDVDDLEKWLLHVVTTEPVPADITAYWFGLFNPYYEGAATSCLYVAGSSRFEAGADNEDWACSPKYFPTGRYANSSILRAIYRAGVDHEEPEGEYFCLWYAAIAVATLCRRLSPILLGRADQRPVAIGFDSGDMILLGTLTVSGFAPLDYTPPSVPIIKPTPSDALFYEIEDDPRGRWWLDHPVAANGDEDDLPFGIGTWCEPINVPTPLRVSVDEDMGGAPVGFTFALTVPIVRLDVAMLIESLIGGDVQLVPVTVIGCANQYRLLNILRSVQCLDLRRSDYTLKDGRKGPVPDAKVADLQYVRRAVIDRRRAGDHHLFRLDEGNQALIASRTMKTRLETALVSGIKFKPLESSFENER